jgi:hypothetical protein
MHVKVTPRFVVLGSSQSASMSDRAGRQPAFRSVYALHVVTWRDLSSNLVFSSNPDSNARSAAGRWSAA